MSNSITDIHGDETHLWLYKLLVPLVSSTRRESNYLKNQFLDYKRLLDLGCGYGRLAIPLALDGKDISGIDIALYQIIQAKQYAKIKELSLDFQVANMVQLPYGDSSFDGVFSMLGSFQYLTDKYDQQRAVNETYRVLRPKGKLIVSVDYNNSGENLFVYNQENLRILVENAGFKHIDFSTMRLGLLRHKKLNLTAIKGE